MLELTREKINNNYDKFYITTDEGTFSIWFSDVLDLYWSCERKKTISESDDMCIFTITKENYFVYQLFKELYNSIKKDEPKDLFIDGKIEWHSDETTYENASCLTIEKEEQDYYVKFKKSKPECYLRPTFCVRINNSGSRYGRYSVNFMKMYNKLKTYNFEYRQMYLEEYEFMQKKLEKNKKL